MAQIDISNIINVNIATAPTMLGSDNVNTIAIFTKEESLNPIKNYGEYTNSNGVGEDFGVDSTTYAMANTIFSQNLNLLAGGGKLFVIPLLANVQLPATSGYVLTQAPDLELWQKAKGMGFTIAVDGKEAVEISNLDFENITTIQEIATIIQEALNTADVEVKVSIVEDEEGVVTGLLFTSNSTGEDSSVVITPPTTDAVEDLTAVNYLNIAKATSLNGSNEYEGVERLQDAVVRANKLLFYEVILTSYMAEASEVMATATIIQSLNKMYIVCSGDLSLIEEGNLFYNINAKKLNKTRCLYNGMGEEFAFASGYASKLCSVNFNGNNTANNLYAKEIVGIVPDTTVNDGLLTQLDKVGVAFYGSMKGLGLIIESGTNEWADTVLFLNWLKMALETAGFNAIRGALTKIPHTEQGVSTIANAYMDILQRAVKLGYVAPGKWLLPFTFGNQELFYNNIQQVGYYLYSNPVAEQSQEERNKRQAPLIQIAIKLAGAINHSDVLVYVNN